MKSRFTMLIALTTIVVLSSVGCATKKYARNQVSDRVTPLEHRTGELEETSRRNTQDIGRLSTDSAEPGRCSKHSRERSRAIGERPANKPG